MIQVCLVDDQTLVRQGIRSLLELSDSIRIVAEASDGKQAVELIPQVKPDVVLMDMRMPVMSGLEALQNLSAQDALPPTIILTTFDDDQLVLAGLKAGAKGYLLKDVSLDQLVGAIETVAKGGSLENAVVVSGDKVLNEDGLRYDDEFVRHKVLDAVGDLYLAGAPIQGHFHGACSGHATNNALLRALFADPSAWAYDVERVEDGLSTPFTGVHALTDALTDAPAEAASA